MSVELGVYKRIVTITIQVVVMGAQAPAGAIKIGTDIETSKDLYITVTYSWIAI